MKAESTRQSYQWIRKIIDSSTSVLHLVTVEKLLENYRKLEPDEELSVNLEINFHQKAQLLNYYAWKKNIKPHVN